MRKQREFLDYVNAVDAEYRAIPGKPKVNSKKKPKKTKKPKKKKKSNSFTAETLPYFEDRPTIVRLLGPYGKKHPVKARDL